MALGIHGLPEHACRLNNSLCMFVCAHAPANVHVVLMHMPIHVSMWARLCVAWSARTARASLPLPRWFCVFPAITTQAVTTQVNYAGHDYIAFTR